MSRCPLNGFALFLVLVAIACLLPFTPAAAKKDCSCVRQWLLKADLSKAKAIKYERIIDQTGLSLTAIGGMNQAVLGLLLHGNAMDARKIQLCINGLSAKCRGYNPCQKGGVCHSGRGGKASTCSCAKGLTGCLCTKDIDECASSKLHSCDIAKRAKCTNIHSSYVCSCKKGYRGGGRKCTDINECTEGSHDCQKKRAKCTNIVGSFTCKCVSPYTGDGKTCTKDLCADVKDKDVCDRVKAIRTNVAALQASLKAQRHQTSLLTNVITQFLTRTSKLDKRLKVESGHVVSLKKAVQKLEGACIGIHSWKHFAKHTRSRFDSWPVTYKKKRKDTSLRVSYSGMIGVHGRLSSYWYCTRVDILFNGNSCSKPAAITSGHVYRHEYRNYRFYSMAPSIVTGHCDGIRNGTVKVTVRIRNGCGSSYEQYYNGNGIWGATTYSLDVEEYCPQ